jgi:2-desacetyl-2-hydroxyethyl bacteriochlorophyllide A dehydrogenase
MKAAVLRGPRDIRVEEFPEPTVEPDGIIMKVRACGVCGSDLHNYRLGGPVGAILGHESTGDVVEVGANATGIEKGDRVFAWPIRLCGQCRWCRQGQYFYCPGLTLPPQHPGAFAEYVSIPTAIAGSTVLRLPDSMAYGEGALAEPLAIALYGVEQAQPQPDDTAVVLGLGIIGLCVVQVLRAMGVSRIITSGRRSRRLQLAKESGASVVVDAAQGDIMSVVREETSGEMADVVFDCAGSPDTFQQSIQVLRKGGKMVVVAIYEQPVTWNPSILIFRNITMLGYMAGNGSGALDLLEKGKVNTEPFISHEFALDDVKEAFETQVEAEGAVKVMVNP